MRKLLRLTASFVLAFGVMTGGTAAFAASGSPVAPPGQGDCSHGNTGKVCGPDPSASGKDCASHGNNGVGGVNEDHCLATTPAATKDKTITGHVIPNHSTPATTLAPTRGPGAHSSTSSQTTTTGTTGATKDAEAANGNRPVPAPAVAKPSAPQAAAATKDGGFLAHKASGLLPY
ncbi:MAG: hypothetical protein QOH23_2263, partial [Gaiellaceae bacterium]|nr:hypothetical protein [Gaiellaceae bacterium]